MDSEATVILRRSGLAKAPSRTSRTESTAVFVGRSSFQMIPAGSEAQRPDHTPGVLLHTPQRPPRLAVTAAEQAQREIIDALRAEARALRAESEARVAAAKAAANTTAQLEALTPAATVLVPQDLIEVQEAPAIEHAPGRRGVVLQLLPQVDVTEPINARARSSGRTRRGGITPRTIFLALVAGASITLSAQAVMRRPGARPSFSSAAATEQVVKPVPATTPVVATMPVAAPSAPFVPTVVASTATASQPEPVVEAPAPAATRKRIRARATGTQRPVVTAKLRHQAKTTWVDPFAGAAPAKPATTTWVDPFAD